MNLLDLLKWRYATKKMNGEKIPTEKLDTILGATKLAPSSFGLTPYKVIVVEDQQLKEKLQPACYGQTQLSESSAVLVFATANELTDVQVDEYMNEIAKQRGISVEMLNEFSTMLKGFLGSMNDEQKKIGRAHV